MRRYEEREIRQRIIFGLTLVEATCDRCGRDARCFGFGAETWGYACRYVQGKGGDQQEYDLCHDCSVAFDKWMGVMP